MLRRSLLLLVGLALSLGISPATAQVDVAPGLRIGMTSTTVGGSGHLGSINRQRGLTVGGFVQIDVPGALAFQPEVLYVQKGAKRVPEVSIPNLKSVVYEVDYVEFPLLIKGQLPIGGPRFSPSLLVGPTVGINVASETRSELMELSSPDLSAPKPVEMGLAAGAGGNYRLDAGTISVDVRYQLGLTDAFHGNAASVRNQGLVLTAGFSF